MGDGTFERRGSVAMAIAALTGGCGRIGYHPTDASTDVAIDAPDAENTPGIVNLVVHDTDPARAALWSIRSNFQVGISGAHPWGDWPDTYFLSADPAAGFLIEDEWIADAAESKWYTGGPQATITLSGTLDLYMLVDDRWGPAPTWTAGWSITGWKMTVWESNNRPSLSFSVYQRPGSSGSLDLPSIGTNIGYNYVVLAD